MKKFLVCALAVGFAVTTANAAKLSIEFAGGATATTVNTVSGGPVEVFITLQLNAGDTLKGIGLRFQETGLNVDLASISDATLTTTAGNASNTLGWGEGSTGTGLGNISDSPGHGYAAFSSDGTPYLGDGSTFTVGSIFLDLAGGQSVGTVVELMINDPASVSLIDNAGGLYGYGPNFASFAGFFDFGTGSPDTLPDVPPFGGQAADPITITYTPEPASLALLAIGGVALLRRRR